jgi:predicted porin
MKKSLLALAVLGAFAGAASAQSSVTLYGRVDLSIGKNVGSTSKYLANGSGSRLGVKGYEDLGGGMGAFFNIEHRLNADTGALTDSARFWNAISIVGLRGSFGSVSLGRHYSTAFLGSQLAADPWGWDTVVANNATAGITGLGVAKVRYDSTVTYNIAANGFSGAVQIAEASDTISTTPKKPTNFALGYAGGPLSVGFGYELTGAKAAAAEKVMTLNGAYDFGSFKLGGLIGNATTAANVKRKSWLLTATAPLGQGEFRAAIGQLKVGTVKTTQAVALGYHYSLSKRTTIYGDFVNNSKATTSKTGYDIGLKHNF